MRARKILASVHHVHAGVRTLLASGSTTLARTLARTHARVASAMHAYIASGSTIRVRMGLIYHRMCVRTYSHSRARTRTLLASTPTLLTSAALTAHEPSRVKHKRALSCL